MSGERPWARLEGNARFKAIEDALTRGAITESAWHEEVGALLEPAYLAAETPYGQSGAGGDGARWERKRRLIAEAINRDGSFLDMGCANGLLMESMTEWATARGHTIEPYGLDISAGLIALARRRLPRWGDRFFVGNALTWEPPRRFDFVRTELVYVPEARRPSLVRRLLDRVVAGDGRLIVCGYGDGGVADRLRAWGHRVAGEANVYYDNGAVWTHVAWVDAAA